MTLHKLVIFIRDCGMRMAMVCIAQALLWNWGSTSWRHRLTPDSYHRMAQRVPSVTASRGATWMTPVGESAKRRVLNFASRLAGKSMTMAIVPHGQHGHSATLSIGESANLIKVIAGCAKTRLENRPTSKPLATV